MTERLRRFRLEYDPDATCCCSVEEHLNGEYVLFSDYSDLLEVCKMYREQAHRYNRDLAKKEKGLCDAVIGCAEPAVVVWQGRAHCYHCLPPGMKGNVRDV